MFDIITGFTPNYLPFSDINSSVTREYCNRHNYNEYQYLIPNDYDRPASWYKIAKLIQHINHGYGYSIWLDADSIIINKNFKLESLIKKNKFLYLSKDINNINAGIMMIQNNSFSMLFLEKVWESTDFLNHDWWEQAAIINLIENNYMDINNHIEYIPQNIFNAYDYTCYGYAEHEGQVNKDSFVFHCPGLSFDKRLELLQKYKNYYL